MANFVPEGEDPGASKRPFGRRSQNFVPAEGQVEAPRLTADEQWEIARQEREARRAGEKQATWNMAVERLRLMNPAQAVRTITGMPPALQQLYLFAEEVTSNRSDILSFFPAAGPQAREAWRPYAGGLAAEPRPDQPVSAQSGE
jgi:hypothetical protein